MKVAKGEKENRGRKEKKENQRRRKERRTKWRGKSGGS